MEMSWVYEFAKDAVLPFVAATTGYLFGFIRKQIKKHPREMFERNKVQDLRIHELLAEIRLTFRAQRAYVCKFHNGDHFVDGSEIMKLSRTHEVVRDGVSHQMTENLEKLTSRFPEQIDMVLTPGPGYELVKEMKIGSHFKAMATAGGVRAIAAVPLEKNKNMIGFIGVDFDDENRPENIQELVQYAQKLEYLL